MTLHPLNHKRLSSTSRMQSCPPPHTSLSPSGHTSPPVPRDLFPRSHRRPRLIGCLPQASAPKDRGLPSSCVVAIALRNTLPESLATAAKTSILVNFIRTALTCPEPEEPA